MYNVFVIIVSKLGRGIQSFEDFQCIRIITWVSTSNTIRPLNYPDETTCMKLRNIIQGSIQAHLVIIPTGLIITLLLASKTQQQISKLLVISTTDQNCVRHSSFAWVCLTLWCGLSCMLGKLRFRGTSSWQPQKRLPTSNLLFLHHHMMHQPRRMSKNLCGNTLCDHSNTGKLQLGQVSYKVKRGGGG